MLLLMVMHLEVSPAFLPLVSFPSGPPKHQAVIAPLFSGAAAASCSCCSCREVGRPRLLSFLPFVQSASLCLTIPNLPGFQPLVLTVITPTMQEATATELTEFAQGGPGAVTWLTNICTPTICRTDPRLPSLKSLL